jgi:trans-2,3-dihydro-3-hydroxyanthranilate isomerase
VTNNAEPGPFKVVSWEVFMSSSRSYRYLVVDVFSERPLEGNPLAVFPDASGIDDATMQKIARELNLSETTFIGPASRADCAAAVRIFTPARELEFAGHPTVGTSFVLLEEGIVPRGCDRFALEEKVGPVPIRVEAGQRPLIWLMTPPISRGRLYERAVCARALGLEAGDLLDIPPQVVSAGNPTLIIALRDESAVDRAWLDAGGMGLLKDGDSGPVCVLAFAPTAGGAYTRVFAPALGIAEDPATGSAAGPLAAFMLQHGFVSGAGGARFVSEQGVKMGRPSTLHVRVNGEQGAAGIEVGGHVSLVAEATMRL